MILGMAENLAAVSWPAPLFPESAPRGDSPMVAVRMVCELSQETASGSFTAALIREETRYWDDDPKPDIIESIVSETEIHALLPDVFSAVDHWLATTYRLRVLPTTWQSGNTGADTGLVVLLQGRATDSNELTLGCSRDALSA